MSQLFSRYTSGLQFTAGAMAGSIMGTSGLNPLVDRLNSISDANQAVTGSLVSGTSTSLFINTGKMTGSPSAANDITTKNYVDVAVLGVSGAAGVTSLIAGDGIDVSAATGDVTVTAETATATNKGVASFNADDFSVSSGSVSLNSKTSYWSCTGVNFKGGGNAGIDDLDYFVDGTAKAVLNSANPPVAMVNLPQSAVVTAAVVYSSVSTENWYLSRTIIASGTSTDMGSAALNTESTSISNATIDNNIYAYSLRMEFMDDEDEIYGARITYTTDHI